MARHLFFLAAIGLIAGFGILRRLGFLAALVLLLAVLLGTGLGLLRLVVAFLRMRQARGIGAAPRQIRRVECLDIGDRRQRHRAVDFRRCAPGIGDCRAGNEQWRKTFINGSAAVVGQRGIHALQRHAVISRRLRMPHAQTVGGVAQALQIIGHVALHAEIDAQILAQIKNQLETQHVVAETREQRRPRHRADGRKSNVRLGEHVLHRRAVEGAITHMAGHMQQRQYRLLAVSHHRRKINAFAVGLDERPAFLGRPVAFLEIKLVAEPDIEQHAEQPVAVGQPVARQVLQQQRQAFLGFKTEVRLAAGASGLQDIGAARRPRQDGLRPQQIAHADGAWQIGRQHQLARFEQLLGRGCNLLDGGNAAVTPRQIQHRR